MVSEGYFDDAKSNAYLGGSKKTKNAL